MRQLDMNTAASTVPAKDESFGILTFKVGDTALEGYVVLSRKNLQRLGLTEAQALEFAGKTAKLDVVASVRFGQAEKREGDGSGVAALRFD